MGGGWMGWMTGLALAALAWIYAGYPAYVALRARLAPRPARRGEFSGTWSVLIAARDEVGRLGPKLDDLLAGDLPDGMQAVWVGSDGSTDGTAAEAESVAARDPRVNVLKVPQRRGKAAMLNDLLTRTDADVLVLTDARQRLAPQAIRHLLENFHDPRLRVVSGELVFVDETGTPTSAGLGFYWRYEKFIRRHEAGFGSVPGATGALYAIRRAHARPLAADTLLDDVALPMMALADGGRCGFDERAVVYDHPATDPAREQARKRRTIAGVAQLARRHPRWLRPGGHPAWFAWLSHKVLRLTSPFLLALVFVGSLGLLSTGWGRGLLAAQGLAYLAAAVGLATAGRRRPCPWLDVPAAFLALQVATVLALLDAARGRYNPAWQKSAP